MPSHEYRVVPAPRRGIRAKGLRRPEDRFAHAIESEMNRMAAEGWEFVRSDTLPRDHKAGWFSRPVTVFDTLLVFRRPVAESQLQQRPAAPMPPPMAFTPPAFVAAPSTSEPAPHPGVAAPAASRFTPAPAALRPANDAAPATQVPTLTLVEPADPGGDPQNPRHAAE